MEKILIYCDRCDHPYDKLTNPYSKFEDAEYLTVGGNHICIPCARQNTVYDFISYLIEKKRAIKNATNKDNS